MGSGGLFWLFLGAISKCSVVIVIYVVSVKRENGFKIKKMKKENQISSFFWVFYFNGGSLDCI